MNKFQIAINKAKAHFGENDIVSRQEILAYEKESGEQIPQKFWAMARTGRAMFSFNQALEAESNPVVQKQPEVVHAIQNIKPVTESKFDYDGLIPILKDTFVEWGEYKTVEKLIASNEFFTLYITGDSGSGKNEMVSHACAKLKRPMVRVQITRETKEEHLLGSKTLVDGSIQYEEGPVIWAAEHGALLILDELACLSDQEFIRIGTVDNYESVLLKSLEIGKEYPMPSFNQTTGKFEDDIGFISKDSVKELYEVELEDGRTVVLTADHPFICSSDNTSVFERSIDGGLKVGDLVVIASDSVE